LEVPPLRQRKQDIPVLICHFIDKLNPRLRTMIANISPKSLKLLEQYHWPGNVREMENMLERAIIMADMENGRSLDCRHFKFLQNRCSSEAPLELQSLKAASQKFEEELIARALEISNFNLAKAAEQLEIDLSTLYKKIKKHGIET
jgi:transcriptional regulator with PAS, ATPase and Fis domain